MDKKSAFKKQVKIAAEIVKAALEINSNYPDEYISDDDMETLINASGIGNIKVKFVVKADDLIDIEVEV